MALKLREDPTLVLHLKLCKRTGKGIHQSKSIMISRFRQIQSMAPMLHFFLRIFLAFASHVARSSSKSLMLRRLLSLWCRLL